MIILDGPPDSYKRRVPRRLSTSPSEVESIQSSNGAPPSYRSDTTRNSLQPMQDSTPPHISRIASVSKAQWPWTRVQKALLYGLALYAVVTIAVAIPYLVTRNRNSATNTPYQRMKPPDPPIESGSDGGPGTPVDIPSTDGDISGCNVWDYSHDYGYPDDLQYSRLTYCIPRNTTNVWIHALGEQEHIVSGDFVVKLNPDADETEYMVDVMLTYPKADVDARDSSAICLMQAEDTWGVGIYTPPNSTNHSLDYQLTFLVPQSKNPLSLSQFTTHLPWFSQSFQDLNTSLTFSNIDIGGIASPVYGTVQANKINVTTSQAEITGSFKASDMLILQTSYAKIDTNITLSNGPGQEGATNLFIKSSQSPFFATVNLSTSGTENLKIRSRTGTAARPQYTTRVSCDDSPVSLIFRHDDALNSSDLDVQVDTTYNRAFVLLDSKFEGNFDLYSTNGSVLVRDLDGNQHQEPDELVGMLPEYAPYKPGILYDRESTPWATGCVKRGIDIRDAHHTVNIKVRNDLALIALGFFKSNVKYPQTSDLLGLT